MPRACVVCDRELGPDEQIICGECASDIPHTYFWLRERNPMADKLNARIKGPYEPYARAIALFFYHRESPYSSITQALKYHRNFKAGRYFSRLLADRIMEAGWMYSDVDLVVPVPLNIFRKWKRGYNQAEIIASEIAAALEAPMAPKLLVRHRHTRSQAKVSSAEKASNVRGAFSVLRELPLPAARHILLVDDVFTSGSTTYECYRALRRHYGPEVRISVATLAYAGE